MFDEPWIRNGDGMNPDATELIGNLTPQPNPPQGTGRNGFLARAVFDRRDVGGNEAGIIDGKDRMFAASRLRNDKRHNGKTFHSLTLIPWDGSCNAWG